MMMAQPLKLSPICSHFSLCLTLSVWRMWSTLDQPAFCLWRVEASTGDDETLLTLEPAESRPHSHSTPADKECWQLPNGKRADELTVRNSEEKQHRHSITSQLFTLIAISISWVLASHWSTPVLSTNQRPALVGSQTGRVEIALAMIYCSVNHWPAGRAHVRRKDVLCHNQLSPHSAQLAAKQKERKKIWGWIGELHWPILELPARLWKPVWQCSWRREGNSGQHLRWRSSWVQVTSVNTWKDGDVWRHPQLPKWTPEWTPGESRYCGLFRSRLQLSSVVQDKEEKRWGGAAVWRLHLPGFQLWSARTEHRETKKTIEFGLTMLVKYLKHFWTF